jgi:hypothetical protein
MWLAMIFVTQVGAMATETPFSKVADTAGSAELGSTVEKALCTHRTSHGAHAVAEVAPCLPLPMLEVRVLPHLQAHSTHVKRHGMHSRCVTLPGEGKEGM